MMNFSNLITMLLPQFQVQAKNGNAICFIFTSSSLRKIEKTILSMTYENEVG